MTRDRPKNGTKSPQNDQIFVHFLALFVPMFGPASGHFDPSLTPKRPKNGQKGSEVTKKNSSKVMYTFIKVHKNTQHPRRILPETPAHGILS